MKYRFIKQLFEVEPNTNVSTDFEPAISIDHTNRIADNINTLRKVLGITDMVPMAEGTVIKRYKTTVTKAAGQVAEGEIIPLSKTERKPLPDLTLSLNKYRKLTTAEAIQKYGRNRALNKSDEALVKEIRKGVKSDFFKLIKEGTGVAAGGANLKQAAAAALGALQVYFEDEDVNPVFFCNPLDVTDYVGDATSNQETFGFKYLENFFNSGSCFLSASVTRGTVYATVSENLNGVYVPSSGDVADVFGLTYDETGLVGMNHTLAADRASIQTLILTGVMFYPEDASGIFASKIQS